MPRQRNPEALLSPRQHEVRRGESRADTRIESRGAVVLLPQCPGGVRVTVVQEPKALEILWRARTAMRRPVRRADHRVQLIVHQRYAGKPGPGPAAHPDREIGAFVGRRVKTLVDDHGHFEPWMSCFERGESGDQPPHRKRRRCRDGDGGPTPGLAQRGDRALELGEAGERGPPQRLALGGKGQRARSLPAQEQRSPDPRFQLLQVPADRGVRDVETSRGRPHATGLVHRREGAEHGQREIHMVSILDHK